jgi:hypothetical protein
VNRTQRVTAAIGVLGIVTVLGAAGARAQAPQKSAQPASAASKAVVPAPAIEPAAAAAVDRMGDYLKTLSAFAIHVETTTDEVLIAGPKVQYGGAIDATYRAPDRLRMRIARDEENDQQFFYDGATLSLWIEAKKEWAGVSMTGTVAEAIAAVESKYDVTFPLGDLLGRAARKELLTDVEAGIVIGTGRVAGVECDHLGFHQAGADWQLWIEKGDRPLPRKMVITTLGEPSQPQHSEILTWDVSPKIDAAMFTFTPPAGAQRIVIAERQAATKAVATKKEVK